MNSEETIAINGGRITKLVEYNGQKAVKRIFPEGNLTITNEIIVLRSLESSGFGLSPKILAESAGELILTFMEGSPAGDSFFFSKEFIEQISAGELVEKIRSFKKIKPQDLELDMERVKRLYEPKFLQIEKYWPYPDDAELVQQWIEKFRKTNYSYIEQKPVLCHNDFNPGNIVYQNGKILGFIDWELAILEGYYRDFGSAYYAAAPYSGWQREFETALTEIVDKHEAECFWNQVLFSLIGDISTFSSMLISGRSEHYKSGKLSKEQLEQYRENNFKLFKEIILKVS